MLKTGIVVHFKSNDRASEQEVVHDSYPLTSMSPADNTHHHPIWRCSRPLLYPSLRGATGHRAPRAPALLPLRRPVPKRPLYIYTPHYPRLPVVEIAREEIGSAQQQPSAPPTEPRRYAPPLLTVCGRRSPRAKSKSTAWEKEQRRVPKITTLDSKPDFVYIEATEPVSRVSGNSVSNESPSIGETDGDCHGAFAFFGSLFHRRVRSNVRRTVYVRA